MSRRILFTDIETYSGTDINTKARYNYAQWCNPKGKGMIPASYRVPGAAVFWSDNTASNIHHVAYLYKPVVAGKPDGDWYIIEARGVMYGVVDFYREAKAAGIHPVIGCEVYVCPDMDNKTSLTRDYSHLILLCENQKGYQNLSRLVSEGFTRGYYYRPRVDFDLLKKSRPPLSAVSIMLYRFNQYVGESKYQFPFS